MSKIKKATQAIGIITGILVCLLAGAYCVGWHLVARNMQANIDYLWQDATNSTDLTIEGQKPRITGFPSPPRFIFKGTIIRHMNGVDFAVEMPEFVFTGFPLTGMTIYLETPKGFTLSERSTQNGITIEKALLNVTLPYSIPAEPDYEALVEWQKREDPFQINKILIQSSEVLIDGHGTAGLDAELQPDIRIDTRVTGMDALFKRLESDKNVKQGSLSAAKGFLDMVSRTDQETGVRYFDTGFLVQKDGIFIGPMRIGEIPRISWPGAPRQTTDELRRRTPPPEASPTNPDHTP